MPIQGIEQPALIPIGDDLRLRKFDDIYDFALKWYQDEELNYMVDGKRGTYDMNQLSRMYHYLEKAGELYFIEVQENGVFRAIGDVAFWQEDIPIVIGEPCYRGKGLGRRVIAALIRRGRELGFDHLGVSDIYDWNEPSRRCFESLGFRACEKTEKGAKYRLELMTNEKIWRIALAQSAIDSNCAPEDFLKEESIVTISRPHPDARKYLPLPFACDLVSYGPNIVAQCSEALTGPVGEYIRKYPAAHAFETPNLHALEKLLAPYGLKVCFMAEYFLPDVTKITPQSCAYELRVLHQADFPDLYTPEWSNALCEKRKELDVLGVGAYDNGKLVGLAGCSADCDDMYQIGVDVLPAYRRRGIASALTSRLALEILALGKVPFYCAAWCNVKSVRNAIKCGFRPAWVNITAREASLVEELNA